MSGEGADFFGGSEHRMIRGEDLTPEEALAKVTTILGEDFFVYLKRYDVFLRKGGNSWAISVQTPDLDYYHGLDADSTESEVRDEMNRDLGSLAKGLEYLAGGKEKGEITQAKNTATFTFTGENAEQDVRDMLKKASEHGIHVNRANEYLQSLGREGHISVIGDTLKIRVPAVDEESDQNPDELRAQASRGIADILRLYVGDKKEEPIIENHAVRFTFTGDNPRTDMKELIEKLTRDGVTVQGAGHGKSAHRR